MYRYDFKAINKETGDERECFFDFVIDDNDFKKKCYYWLENCYITDIRKTLKSK